MTDTTQASTSGPEVKQAEIDQHRKECPYCIAEARGVTVSDLIGCESATQQWSLLAKHNQVLGLD